MNIDQINAPRKPLRLWPGVVAVTLQWLIRFGLPVAAPEAQFFGFNAQLVAGKAQLSDQELLQAFKSGYEKLIDFVQTMPEEQLAGQRKFGQLEGSLGDIMASILVLHGIAHIYGAGGSPLG